MLQRTHGTRFGRQARGVVGLLMVAGALVAGVPGAHAAGPPPVPAVPGRYHFSY